MTFRINSQEELAALFDKPRADRLAPKEKYSAKAVSKKRQNVLTNTGRRYHVIVFRIFVAVLAYTLLAAGWLIGAIGDAIYEVGQRMHEGKWNIT